MSFITNVFFCIALISILYKVISDKKNKAVETTTAQRKSGYKIRYKDSNPCEDFKEKVFTNAVSMYLYSLTGKELLDWDYQSIGGYHAICTHYAQWRNYVWYMTKSGEKRTRWVNTQDVWGYVKAKEEEVKIPMDDIQIWIAEKYLNDILPRLKALTEDSFVYPIADKEQDFIERLAERLSANTDYICIAEDKRLVFGIMPSPDF
jgi:hypothetical protein